MRFRELVRFALRGLRRQKARTLLTTLGVAVGACMLAFSVSLGVGLRGLIHREFHTRPGFWEIHVQPGLLPPLLAESEIPAGKVKVDGAFSTDRAARLRRQLVQRYQRFNAGQPPAMLTDESVAKLAALPNVTDVIASRWHTGYAYQGAESAFANVTLSRLEPARAAARMLAGRLPGPDAAECAVSEMLLYDLGVRDDAAMAAKLGTTLEVEFAEHRKTRQATVLQGTATKTDEEAAAAAKLTAMLPAFLDSLALAPEDKAALKGMLARAKSPPAEERPAAGTFTIVGIFRAPVPADESERASYAFRWTTVYLDGPSGEALFRQMPHLKDGHYEGVEVKVTPGSDLPAVVDSVEALGFRTTSVAEWFQNARREVTLIGAGLNVFAVGSLLVAALGITNTLVTSVVERTREIGMMKAVGATGGQVRAFFLIEGALIGLLGGALGLLFARLAAGPADHFVKQQVQAMMGETKMVTESVFDFPLWLSLLTPLFAMLVTTLAALYPSHRAACIAPIEALRYG